MTEQEMIEVVTKPCIYCNQGGSLLVPRAGWVAYDNGRGEYIQNAFPTLSADQREQLLTGIHGPCFDKMFPPDEEEDGDD